MDLRSLEPG